MPHEQLHFDFLIAIHRAGGGTVLLEFEHSMNSTASVQSAADALNATIVEQLALLATGPDSGVTTWQQ